MTTVSAPPRARRERPAPAPAPSIERHGTTRLFIEINRQLYKLRQVRPLPAGIVAAWGIVKIDHDRAESVAYAVASDGVEIKCTCPDHSINGAECKHIRSLIAQGLIDRPDPAEPVAEPVAEAPAQSPAESPADQFRGAVRKEVARLAGAPAPARQPWEDTDTLPEGWTRGGASPPPRPAAPAPSAAPAPARKPKARKPKAPAPSAAPSPALPPGHCLACDRPIRYRSPAPALCASCYDDRLQQEGGAQ